jgi:hypothetical protein
MAKRKEGGKPRDEAVLERIKQGLRYLLATAPETHKQMIERRRAEGAKRTPRLRGK